MFNDMYLKFSYYVLDIIIAANSISSFAQVPSIQISRCMRHINVT